MAHLQVLKGKPAEEKANANAMRKLDEPHVGLASSRRATAYAYCAVHEVATKTTEQFPRPIAQCLNCLEAGVTVARPRPPASPATQQHKTATQAAGPPSRVENTGQPLRQQFGMICSSGLAELKVGGVSAASGKHFRCNLPQFRVEAAVLDPSKSSRVCADIHQSSYIEGPRRPNNSQLMPAFGLQYDKCVLNYNLIPECLRFCVHRCDLHSSDCHRLDDGSQAPAKGSPAAGDRQPAGSRAREILGEEPGSLQSLVLSGMGCSVHDQVSRLDVTHRKVAWSVCNTGRWVPCSSRGASCLECAPAK